MLDHVGIGIVIIVATAALGVFFRFVLGTVGRRIVARTRTELDNIIVDIIGGRIVSLSILAGISVGIREIRKGITEADVTTAQILDYAEVALFVILVIVITRLAIRLTEGVFSWYMDQVGQRTLSNVKATIAPLTNKILNVVFFLVASIILLDHFGINIGSLLVSLGVASLAVALAAQDTLANIIAGFVIMIDRPFRLGDRVQLPSGDVGDVHEIGLRSTRILNFDNNLIIIPNAELIKSRIVNYSYPHDTVRLAVDVGVGYGTDIDRVKSIMLDLAGSHPAMLGSSVPEVFLVDLGESAIRVRLNATIHDYRRKFAIETSLREEIYRTFQKEGIEIPFPQRVVHISHSPDASQIPQKKKTVRRKGL